MLHYLSLAAPEELTTEEMREVSNILQIPVLRKFLATELKFAIGERIGAIPDPLSYAKFIQQEAHVKGNIARLTYLLQLGDVDLGGTDEKSVKLVSPNNPSSIK